MGVYSSLKVASIPAAPARPLRSSSAHPASLTMSRTGTPSNVPSNTLLLRRQLAELTKHPVDGFSAGENTLLSGVHCF